MAGELTDVTGIWAPPRDAVVLPLVGDVDLAGATELVADVARALGGGTSDVILDLAGVTFCDTSGLDAIVAAQRLGQELGATVALRNTPMRVRRLLEVVGLDGVLPTPVP